MTLKGFKGYNDGIAEGYAKALDDVEKEIRILKECFISSQHGDYFPLSFKTWNCFKQEIAKLSHSQQINNKPTAETDKTSADTNIPKESK